MHYDPPSVYASTLMAVDLDPSFSCPRIFLLPAPFYKLVLFLNNIFILCHFKTYRKQGHNHEVVANGTILYLVENRCIETGLSYVHLWSTVL